MRTVTDVETVGRIGARAAHLIATEASDGDTVRLADWDTPLGDVFEEVAPTPTAGRVAEAVFGTRGVTDETVASGQADQVLAALTTPPVAGADMAAAFGGQWAAILTLAETARAWTDDDEQRLYDTHLQLAHFPRACSRGLPRRQRRRWLERHEAHSWDYYAAYLALHRAIEATGAEPQAQRVSDVLDAAIKPPPICRPPMLLGNIPVQPAQCGIWAGFDTGAALVVRDVLNSEHYRLLTAVYTATIGPAHPDDPRPLTARAVGESPS